MKNFKKLLTVMFVVAVMTMFTGCIKPYDEPELVTLNANQTGFLIDLLDGENQGSFDSEAALESARISTKEIQIPHRWLQTGRRSYQGKWIPTAKLIVVDRTPVTREWNSTKDSGTSVKNQAIYAESSESIGFSVGMNISAQVYSERDASTFLYSYNTKSLEEIMDEEIRSYIETVWNELCGKLTMTEINKRKGELMEETRSRAKEEFKNHGITITTLGMKDGIEYDDPAIQAAINAEFIAEQALRTAEKQAQVDKKKAETDKTVAILKAEQNKEVQRLNAEAEAEANKKKSDSITPNLLKLKELENQKILYEKWKGEVPKLSTGSSTSLLNFDANGLID